MKVDAAKPGTFSTDGTIQCIKQYDATSDLSYSDFKYGNSKRYGLGESSYQKRRMNIGLSTVYTATLHSVDILTKYYPLQGQTHYSEILFYAHGSGHRVNGDYAISIPDGSEGSIS